MPAMRFVDNYENLVGNIHGCDGDTRTVRKLSRLHPDRDDVVITEKSGDERAVQNAIKDAKANSERLCAMDLIGDRNRLCQLRELILSHCRITLQVDTENDATHANERSMNAIAEKLDMMQQDSGPLLAGMQRLSRNDLVFVAEAALLSNCPSETVEPEREQPVYREVQRGLGGETVLVRVS